MHEEKKASLSVVVIGRNQPSLLSDCLHSVGKMKAHMPIELIYVDSASTDESVEVAKSLGAKVLSVDSKRPNAAIARNIGWRHSKGEWILFLDGDTLIDPLFFEKAFAYFKDPKVGIVFGHRRERFPRLSIYQQALDLDWASPLGKSKTCGGDILIRKSVLNLVGGYNELLAAGEEPEMCTRIRDLGLEILHIDVSMTLHDLKMHSFSQYWRRCFRTGYAYANVYDLSQGKQHAIWGEEVRGNLLKGFAILVLSIAAVISLGWTFWPLIGLMLLAAFLILRTAFRVHKNRSSSWPASLLYGIHSHFQHIPMLFGQISYWFTFRS